MYIYIHTHKFFTLECYQISRKEAPRRRFLFALEFDVDFFFCFEFTY